MWSFDAPRLTGLSPPTRGNQCIVTLYPMDIRPIPAHAGEPAVALKVHHPVRAYPRPRGGTPRCVVLLDNDFGLSPPTRGNLRLGPPMPALLRSIPAHAGEPVPGCGGMVPPEVYPRPRGGTMSTAIQRGARRGLSPPTRGNLVGLTWELPFHRSIPAHAGEPRGRRPCSPRSWVYPRPRGGTRLGPYPRQGRLGLSPPTRGNRMAVPDDGGCGRSIPAHAGEPSGLWAR